MSCEKTASEIIDQISGITTDINALRQDKIAEIQDIRNATIRCLIILDAEASLGGNRTKRARKTKKLTNRVKY